VLAARLYDALNSHSLSLGHIFKNFFLSHIVSPHINRDYAFHFLYECCDHSFLHPSEIIDRVLIAAQRGLRGNYRTAFLPLADAASLPALLHIAGIDSPDLATLRELVRWGCRAGTIEWAVVTDDGPLLARLLSPSAAIAETPPGVELFEPVTFRDLLSMILYFGSRQCFRQFLTVYSDPLLFLVDISMTARCALVGGDVEAIRWLLRHDGALPALLAHAHLPALCHRLDLVEWLLAQSPESPEAALAAVLHAAARSNCVDVALFALGRGVDVNRKTDGSAPLHGAAARESADVLRLLVSDAAADVNTVNDAGETPLHIAAKLGSVTVVKLLLARADVDVDSLKAGTEQTPLILAVRDCHAGAVAALLADARVDVNAHDRELRRAIHYAAIADSLEIVKLLESRPNLYARAADANGDTALDLAQQCSRSREVIAELERLSVPPAYRSGRI
jgi:hypothetical protein